MSSGNTTRPAPAFLARPTYSRILRTLPPRSPTVGLICAKDIFSMHYFQKIAVKVPGLSIKDLFMLPVIIQHGLRLFGTSGQIVRAILRAPFPDAFVRHFNMKLQAIGVTPYL